MGLKKIHTTKWGIQVEEFAYFFNFCHVLLDCGKNKQFLQEWIFWDENRRFEEPFEPSLDKLW